MNINKNTNFKNELTDEKSTLYKGQEPDNNDYSLEAVEDDDAQKHGITESVIEELELIEESKERNDPEILENIDDQGSQYDPVKDSAKESANTIKNENDNHDLKNNFNIENLNVIEEKVYSILHSVNIGLQNPSHLCKMIIKDIFINLVPDTLTDQIKTTIIDIITNIVYHEFNEFKLKENNRKEKIWQELKTLIEPFLDNELTKYRQNSLHNLTMIQKSNIIKILTATIDKKFISINKEIRKLSFEEYEYLKTELNTIIKNKAQMFLYNT